MRAWVALAAVMLAGCATAQTPAKAAAYDEEAEQGKAETAFKQSRARYQGYEPFAVAQLSPFVSPDWYVVSFFTYWTGFAAEKNERQHWVVKKVAGKFPYFDDFEDEDVPGVPGKETWADSAKCPALEHAVMRFDLHSRAEFTDGSLAPLERPKNNGRDSIVIGTSDSTQFLFWARLGGAGLIEINLSEPYGVGEISQWMDALLNRAEDCFVDKAPDLPAPAHDRVMGARHLGAKPFSIFD